MASVATLPESIISGENSMCIRHALFAAFVLIMAVASGFAEPPDNGWDVVVAGNVKMAVPKGWRKMDGILPRMVVYRQGDGIGVPAVDETGSPLQIGLIVEKFPVAEESVAEIVDGLIKLAKKAPRLEMVGKEIIEDVKLADGSAGKLLTTEFIKEGTRRSLQMKLVVKDGAGGVWIASSQLVGGKESKWPNPGSKYGKWLKAHLFSFSLDPQKFNEEPIRMAYADVAN